MGSVLALEGCQTRAPAPYAGFVDEPVAAVAAQTTGRIASVEVHEGDHVKQGQLLAQIDSGDRAAAVAVAAANVERAKQGLKEARANLHVAMPAVRGAGAEIQRAQANLDEAQANYDRTQHLVDSGAQTPADLDTARAHLLEARATVESGSAAKAQSQGKLNASFAAIDNAEAAVHSAEAELAMARVQLEQTRVLSPFDGIVVSRNLEPGEWAAPGTPVVSVEDTSAPWVRLDIEETDFRELRLGGPAGIHVIALGERRFGGHVTQIGAEGDFAVNRDVKRGRPDVRTFLVRVAFEHAPAELRPGMTAEVSLLPPSASVSSSPSDTEAGFPSASVSATPSASGRPER